VTYPNGGVQAQIRVPVDDTNTVVYWYNAKPRPKGQAPKPDCRVWDNPLRDSRGEYLTDNLNGQDLMVMFTQGEISDRSLENLGESDRGVVLYRKVLLEQLDKIERGEEPLGVVRDPAKNDPWIELPMEKHVGYTLTGVKAAPISTGTPWFPRRPRNRPAATELQDDRGDRSRRTRRAGLSVLGRLDLTKGATGHVARAFPAATAC
jgi:5,5'-dehydrodivanillate O-demethylase